MGIGPSTKETSLHHFRDPLLDVVSSDEDLDLMGIIIVGTPDDNTDKLLVGTRAAVWAEAMRADGVILSSDGWGNSDVDFANTAEQMEIRGIPVTGLKFSGTVGQFVVENDHLGEILFRLLPAGSITGAPKYKTIEIIEQAEEYERGFYTGITGYFDGRKLDSAVMIRFIEEQNGQIFFKSGGGITCKSDLENEYNEMKQKVYVPIY